MQSDSTIESHVDNYRHEDSDIIGPDLSCSLEFNWLADRLAELSSADSAVLVARILIIRPHDFILLILFLSSQVVECYDPVGERVHSTHDIHESSPTSGPLLESMTWY